MNVLVLLNNSNLMTNRITLPFKHPKASFMHTSFIDYDMNISKFSQFQNKITPFDKSNHSTFTTILNIFSYVNFQQYTIMIQHHYHSIFN